MFFISLKKYFSKLQKYFFGNFKKSSHYNFWKLFSVCQLTPWARDKQWQDRQADRQAGTKADRHAERQTERQTDRQPDGQDRQTDRLKQQTRRTDRKARPTGEQADRQTKEKKLNKRNKGRKHTHTLINAWTGACASANARVSLRSGYINTLENTNLGTTSDAGQAVKHTHKQSNNDKWPPHHHYHIYLFK